MDSFLVSGSFLAFVGSGYPQSKIYSEPTDLGGTSWQLVKFEGGNGTILAPSEKAEYTIAFASDGRVRVRIDCNRGLGTWKSAMPSQLEFGPLALTRAMGPAAPLNARLQKDWQYILKEDHVFLSLMADGGPYDWSRSVK